MSEMISEKDRSQLLIMAGNIACGIVSDGFDHHYDDDQMKWIGRMSAQIALETMKAVDKEIKMSN